MSDNEEEEVEREVEIDRDDIEGRREKTTARPGCRKLKNCFYDLGERREKVEDCLNLALPKPLRPCLGCCSLAIKWELTAYATQLIIPFLCLMALLSCCFRCLRCPVGQDVFYSTVECCEAVEDCIDLFYDVGFWRAKERVLEAEHKAKRKSQKLEAASGVDKKDIEKIGDLNKEEGSESRTRSRTSTHSGKGSKSGSESETGSKSESRSRSNTTSSQGGSKSGSRSTSESESRSATVSKKTSEKSSSDGKSSKTRDSETDSQGETASESS